MPRIPLPRDHVRPLKRALLASVALCRAVLLHVRAGFEDSLDPRAQLVAELDRAREIIVVQEEELRLLRARLSSMPPKARPHFRPEDRFAILLLRSKVGWTLAETARRFVVTAKTIAGWMKRVDEGSLVKTPTPVTRHTDRIALLVKELAFVAPSLGRRRLADVLARAGLLLSASTVRRLKRREIPPDTTTPPAAASKSSAKSAAAASTNAGSASPERVVFAKYPHHLWHTDITTIATAGFFLPFWPFSLFTLWPFSWHIALVVDHFSRALVAFAIFKSEPSARDITTLLDAAVIRAGKAPRHIVSDRGAQFSGEYRAWCERSGAKPRFGAVGKHGSIAVIERFIRSLKYEHLFRLLIPFSHSRLEAQLGSYMTWYNEHRPHDALGGATPDEALHEHRPFRPRFEPRPRFPLDEGDPSVRRCERLEMTVRFEGGHRHLPVVELREAA